MAKTNERYLPGYRKGLLTLLKRLPKARGLFRCDCGNETDTLLYNVQKGRTSSCGCRQGRTKDASIEKRPGPCECGSNSWRAAGKNDVANVRYFCCTSCQSRAKVYQGDDGATPFRKPSPDCPECKGVRCFPAHGTARRPGEQRRKCEVCGFVGHFSKGTGELLPANPAPVKKEKPPKPARVAVAKPAAPSPVRLAPPFTALQDVPPLKIVRPFPVRKESAWARLDALRDRRELEKADLF